MWICGNFEERKSQQKLLINQDGYCESETFAETKCRWQYCKPKDGSYFCHIRIEINYYMVSDLRAV